MITNSQFTIWRRQKSSTTGDVKWNVFGRGHELAVLSQIKWKQVRLVSDDFLLSSQETTDSSNFSKDPSGKVKQEVIPRSVLILIEYGFMISMKQDKLLSLLVGTAKLWECAGMTWFFLITYFLSLIGVILRVRKKYPLSAYIQGICMQLLVEAFWKENYLDELYILLDNFIDAIKSAKSANLVSRNHVIPKKTKWTRTNHELIFASSDLKLRH